MANLTATKNASKPLSPQHIYTSLDKATRAACCLCGLHEDGATIHGRGKSHLTQEFTVTLPPSIGQESEWPLVGVGWTAYYTITRANK